MPSLSFGWNGLTGINSARLVGPIVLFMNYLEWRKQMTTATYANPVTIRPEWETIINRGANGATERLRLDHGWLYRVWERHSGYPPGSYTSSMTFVPDRHS
jgi:hypothetical protein